MRPKGSKADLEVRRRTAVALVAQGLSHREVAKRLGCVPGSVSRWKAMARERGDGLKARPQGGGSKAQLSEEARERLRDILVQGARASGWRNELWTLSRVQAVIEREFGIRYHISHVHRLLRAIGFSCQKPERRAREQDPRLVEEFRGKTWPALKKSPE